MKEFTVIRPEQINGNPFQMIGSEWMLITAQKDGQVNTMTASWGGLGVMWGKNVAYIVLRPSRYTKTFVDAADTFSLTFFDRSFRKQLAYLGAVSGRDEPKIEKSGLTVAFSDTSGTSGQAGQAGKVDESGATSATPYFEEARLVLICRKLYQQVYDPDGFLDPAIEDNYPIKDYHTLYIAEITQVLAEPV